MDTYGNPLRWWVLHRFRQEQRRLVRDGMSADSARYVATAHVVLAGPWDPGLAHRWIECYLSSP